MCGFLCVIDFNHKIDDYTNILNSSSLHRGPDNQNYTSGENFYFYFRRLSIQDLNNRSNQPFVNKNKNIYMVFNGEIYNFKELRDELKSLGHQFDTTGDTEVLMKCYEEWQENCVNKLQGMFSFCIWDNIKKKFFAFRDRFGIKPLYYCKYKSKFIISSEIKDIIAINNKKSENQTVVIKYLARGFLDDSSETFYKNIVSLKPGKYISLTREEFQIKKFWELEQGDERKLDKDEFLNIFRQTINLHLRSDVPIAFALSGGVDSNAIASLSVNNKINKNYMKAFSIIPPHTVDETIWINRAVNAYGIDHSYVNSTEINSANDFSKVLFYHDEPFHSSSIYYHFLLRQEIKKEKFKVLMVGEGADEVLAGYRRMIYPYIHDLEKNQNFEELNTIFDESIEFMGVSKNELLNNYMKFKEKLSQNLSDNETSLNPFYHEDLLNDSIFHKRYNLEKYVENNSTLKQSLFDHVFKRDLPYVLRMEDRNSMGNSIEARVPFLDHKLVEYIFSINPKQFMKSGLNKYILRHSLIKFLPNSIVSRRTKSARPGSDSHFMDKVVKEEFLDLIHDEQSLKHMINVDQLKSNYLEKDKNKKIMASNLEFRVYSYLKWKNLNSSTQMH